MSLRPTTPESRYYWVQARSAVRAQKRNRPSEECYGCETENGEKHGNPRRRSRTCGRILAMKPEMVAIVTGAAQGIGRATAWELAREGKAVVIADLERELGETAARELVAGGHRALALETDVS